MTIPVIRPATVNDTKQICYIYNYYILNTVVTFEEEPVSSEEMAKRIADVSKELVWLVYEEEGLIKGYAYITKWRVRTAYRYSVESTVYVDKDWRGHGIGKKLYSELLLKAKEKGIHVAIGGISLPNDDSVRIHEKFGFEKVAHFKEVGFKFNTWVDVGYWQLNL